MSEPSPTAFNARTFKRANRKTRLTSSMLFIVIAIFFIFTVIWATFTELEEVVRGEGKVIPSGKVQQLQSYDGGIVTKVHVRRGALVEKGDILMELDTTRTSSDRNQLQQQQNSLSAEIYRLTATARGQEPKWPDALRKEAPAVVLVQERLYTARKIEFEADLQVLRQQLVQRQTELAESQAVMNNAGRSLVLARQELALVEPLVKKGIEPETSLIRLRRSVVDLEGQQQNAELAGVRHRAGIQEAQGRADAQRERFRSDALKDLSLVTAKMVEVEQALPAREDRVNRGELRSPVRGIVKQVAITTVGSVAQPGATLIEIVPADDTLMVEAQMRPEDIAFLHPGQTAKVKLTAYDATRFGSMDGEVVTISADSIEMPQTGGLPSGGKRSFPIEVRTTSLLKAKNGKILDVMPGMVAEVDVVIGKRSILQYLFTPVLRMQDKAFRER
jgi:adhesin transport system membrane fusion protein